MANVDAFVADVLAKLVARDPNQPEFKQAAEEVRSPKPAALQHDRLHALSVVGLYAQSIAQTVSMPSNNCPFVKMAP